MWIPTSKLHIATSSVLCTDIIICSQIASVELTQCLNVEHFACWRPTKTWFIFLQPFPFRRENIWSNLNTFWANDFYFAHLHHQSHRFLITRCLYVTILHFDRSTHTGYSRMAPVVKCASIYYVRWTFLN